MAYAAGSGVDVAMVIACLAIARVRSSAVGVVRRGGVSRKPARVGDFKAWGKHDTVTRKHNPRTDSREMSFSHSDPPRNVGEHKIEKQKPHSYIHDFKSNKQLSPGVLLAHLIRRLDVEFASEMVTEPLLQVCKLPAQYIVVSATIQIIE